MSKQTPLVELTIQAPMLPAIASASQMRNFAESVVVDSDLACEIASAEYTSCRDQWKALDEARLKLKRPITEAGRAIDDFFRDALTFLDESSKTLNRKVSDYLQDQERRRQEAEARARRIAEEERQRIARDAAEAERLAREKAEKLRQEAEEQTAAGNKTAAAALKSEAIQTEMRGQQEAQQTLELAETLVPVPVAQVSVPSSVSTKETWRAEVVNLSILVEAVAGGRRRNCVAVKIDRRTASRAPLTCIEPNMTALNRAAVGFKAAFSMPGCKAVPDIGIAKKRVGK